MPSDGGLASSLPLPIAEAAAPGASLMVGGGRKRNRVGYLVQGGGNGGGIRNLNPERAERGEREGGAERGTEAAGGKRRLEKMR